MNDQLPLAPAIITQIDEEIARLEPIMDDYDGGQVEGLRKAGAIVSSTARARWADVFSEYKHTGGCF